LQLTVNNRHARPEAGATLAALAKGQQCILERFELPDEVSRRLMEIGFLPGAVVTAAHSAPGGDPRVFRVDGCEIALRAETAARIHVRPIGPRNRR